MRLKHFLPDINLQASDKSLLRNLMWLRFFEIVGLFMVGLSSHFLFRLEVPTTPFLATLVFLIAGNLLVLFRLNIHWPVTQLELFLNLLADCIILTLFMSHTGGASNPFISLYLIFIAVSATTLALRYTILMVLTCAAMYSLLIFRLPMDQHLHQNDFQLHMFGMWINFLLGSLCLLLFISLLRRALTEREKLIHQNKEQLLRNEHILALGSMAAGAAHELSTPLSTVNLLTETLLAQEKNPQRLEDLKLIQQQISLCKQTINSLRENAEDNKKLLLENDTLKNHLETVFDKWLLLWPQIEEHINYLETFDNFQLEFDKRLQQSLLSILNNASEASRQKQSQNVFIDIDCQNHLLKLWVYDEGEGIAEEIKTNANKMVLSTKQQGYGLGLLLSHSNIEQLGGKIIFSNMIHKNSQSKTGACCYIELTIKP